VYMQIRGSAGAGIGLTGRHAEGAEDLEARGRLAPLERAHEAVRLIGHELHHLWREKSGHSSNPIHPVYEAEAQRRMMQVRENWLNSIRNGGAQARRELGIPTTTRIQQWEDIPAAAQKSIEKGAAGSDFIDGLYQRSAYLVEEIYTKIEELSYLRIQQRDTTPGVYDPSRWAVSALASEIYFLHNVLNSVADPAGPVTPELASRADREMLAFLRRRYPSRSGSQNDSYEVVFYLCAIRSGIPPIYNEGKLISHPPSGIRPAPSNVP